MGRLRCDLFKDNRQTFIQLTGQLDESGSLAQAVGHVDPPLIIDLANVTLMNSIGVRDWVRFLKAVSPRGPVTLRHCPAFMVNQFNLVRGAATGVTVESFQAPYLCEGCGSESMVELLPAVHLQGGLDVAPPDFPCTKCGGSLRFDDFPESYFIFLIARP
jgi:hypothetical protein